MGTIRFINGGCSCLYGMQSEGYAKSNPGSSTTVSRRQFLVGLGAGAVIGAIVAVGIEELRFAPPTTPTTPTPTEAPPPVEEPVYAKEIALTVNGVEREVTVPNNWTLLDALINKLRLTGTKEGCNRGGCGACTVLMDGKAVYSCMILAVEADKSDVMTVEGLGTDVILDPIQESFIEHDATQCGFCIPGHIMAAKALLNKISRPSREQVLKGLSGNICTCSAAWEIVEAVLAVR